VKRLLLIFSLVVLLGGVATAQRNNTFYVDQFAGSDVGTKAANAQKACNANTAVTCVIVFDPELSQYPAGTLPSACSQCLWVDYRGQNPFGTSGLYQYVGFRNRFINGLFQVDQRNGGAAQTITAGGNLAYTVDHWYAYSTGANIVGQQYNWQGGYQFTGAAGVTSVSFGQRIESRYVVDLTNAVMSIGLWSNSLTSVTWSVYLCNTQDSCGSVSAPTHQLMSTGTCTVSSVVSECVVPLSFTGGNYPGNGVEVIFKTGVFASGNLVFSGAQLEGGFVNTPFERRPLVLEQVLCQRYWQKIGGTSSSDVIFGGYASAASQSIYGSTMLLPVQMFSLPQATIVGTWNVVNGSQPIIQAITSSSVSLVMSSAAAGPVVGYSKNTTTYITLNAEL
jgi:hypothetical protein